ncbi:hypothetical protein NMY22_g1542 [Coprinellus aureogranulatus]|nr:hypothetical protein NMY22_g1542 [Coprinellus aureogranulatus]
MNFEWVRKGCLQGWIWLGSKRESTSTAPQARKLACIPCFRHWEERVVSITPPKLPYETGVFVESVKGVKREFGLTSSPLAQREAKLNHPSFVKLGSFPGRNVSSALVLHETRLIAAPGLSPPFPTNSTRFNTPNRAQRDPQACSHSPTISSAKRGLAVTIGCGFRLLERCRAVTDSIQSVNPAIDQVDNDAPSVPEESKPRVSVALHPSHGARRTELASLERPEAFPALAIPSPPTASPDPKHTRFTSDTDCRPEA